MKLRGYSWINYGNLRAALDRLQAGKLPDDIAIALSKNYYVIDPDDWSVWDLKVVVKVASWIAANESEDLDPLTSYDFSPGKFPKKIQRSGFAVLYFNREKQRKLGLSDDFDPAEFKAQHELRLPNEEVIPNGFRIKAETAVDGSRKEVTKVIVEVQKFVRDRKLKEQTLKRANGRCEACGNRAFRTLGGDWFLEVHHKKWLSEGGQDTVANMVALCPNCHRQEHHGKRKYC